MTRIRYAAVSSETGLLFVKIQHLWDYSENFLWMWNEFAMNSPTINKTMDPGDLAFSEAAKIVAELNSLITVLMQRGVRISSWYGYFDLLNNPQLLERTNRGYNYRPLIDAADDTNFPWYLYWEIVWVIMNGGFKQGDKVLDLGGSSSLFSYFLASRGCSVTTIDMKGSLVSNANDVAKVMGWRLINIEADVTKTIVQDEFDHVTSICVFEHIPLKARIEVNKSLARCLRKGGRMSITFDYRNPSRLVRIDTPGDVQHQFVDSSGFKIRGNPIFNDDGKNHLLHPFYYKPRLWDLKKRMIRDGEFSRWEYLRAKSKNDYTFGALFMENI